jgi:hypothetical protein
MHLVWEDGGMARDAQMQELTTGPSSTDERNPPKVEDEGSNPSDRSTPRRSSTDEQLATNQTGEGSIPSGGSNIERFLSMTMRKRLKRMRKTMPRAACDSYRWKQKHNDV